MRTDTFRAWLAERGCRFDQSARGTGHGVLTVHLEQRSAELEMPGPHKSLDEETVRRVCEELGLDWSQLPGPIGRA